MKIELIIWLFNEINIRKDNKRTEFNLNSIQNLFPYFKYLHKSYLIQNLFYRLFNKSWLKLQKKVNQLPDSCLCSALWQSAKIIKTNKIKKVINLCISNYFRICKTRIRTCHKWKVDNKLNDIISDIFVHIFCKLSPNENNWNFQ